MNNKRYMYFSKQLLFSLYIKVIIQNVVNKSIIVQVRD